jgi:hypothetical protein
MSKEGLVFLVVDRPTIRRGGPAGRPENGRAIHDLPAGGRHA